MTAAARNAARKSRVAPVHPGEILLGDFMQPLGLTQYVPAKALGGPALRISQIVRGQRSISADTALRLSRYFRTRPEWWLDLQTHHDVELARNSLEVRIARAVRPRVELQAT